MRYFVMAADGQRYGPADIALLQQWVTEGRILSHYMLQEEQSGRQVMASTINGLYFPPTPSAPYIPGPSIGNSPGRSQGSVSQPCFGQPGPSPFGQGAPAGQTPVGGTYYDPYSPAQSKFSAGFSGGVNPLGQSFGGGGDARNAWICFVIGLLLLASSVGWIPAMLGYYFGRRAKRLGNSSGAWAAGLNFCLLLIPALNFAQSLLGGALQ